MTKHQSFIYDLIHEVRSNPSFNKRVLGALRDTEIVYQARADGKADLEDVTRAELRLLEASGFNYGLLIPKYFPTYPFNKPLDFSSRPFMFAMTSLNLGSVVTLKAGRQVGKCATGDTEVVTKKGKMTLSDIFDKASTN